MIAAVAARAIAAEAKGIKRQLGWLGGAPAAAAGNDGSQMMKEPSMMRAKEKVTSSEERG